MAELKFTSKADLERGRLSRGRVEAGGELFRFSVPDYPGRFSWDYLERGPAAWRVRIARIA